MNRRLYLHRAGVGAMVVVTGCGARPDGSTDSAAEADGNSDASSADTGPESVVRRYFEAVDDGDRSAANRLVLDEDVPMYVESDEPRDITVQTVEERDLRTMLRQTQDVSGDTLDSRVERNRESFDEYVDENGYADWAVVYASVDTDQRGEQEGYYILYETDDGWVPAGVTN